MLPVLGREVVDVKQRFAILDHSYLTPQVSTKASNTRAHRVGHPGLLQRAWLSIFGTSAAYSTHCGPRGLRPHFLYRLPEAERAVGDRELGRHLQARAASGRGAVPSRIACCRSLRLEGLLKNMCVNDGPN
jgi:hypothetical protein